MTDFIAKAAGDAKKAALKEADGAIQNVEATVTAQVDAALGAVNEQLDNLPLDIDPELLLREKEAELLDKKAELDRLLLVGKDELIEEARSKLSSLSIPSNPFPIKLPPLEPKVLARVAMLKLMKEIRELRKKISKENITKGMTLYSYPINRKIPIPPELPELPTIPDLPKLPPLPTLPPLPDLPELPPPPTLPALPSVDNILSDIIPTPLPVTIPEIRVNLPSPPPGLDQLPQTPPPFDLL
jgi:hypothetical protein